VLPFRSLDPFRALREPDPRRRDEKRPFPLRTKNCQHTTQNNRLTGKAPYKSTNYRGKADWLCPFLIEHLSLLRRAHGHRPDLRTWLRASALAHPIARARQLMTTTLLPPVHITPPGQGRYPAGNGRAPPTATISAHADHQNADRSAQHRRPDPAQGDQSRHRATGAAGTLVRNPQIRSNTAAKSP